MGRRGLVDLPGEPLINISDELLSGHGGAFWCVPECAFVCVMDGTDVAGLSLRHPVVNMIETRSCETPCGSEPGWWASRVDSRSMIWS